MNLSTVEIPRTGARERAAQYRRIARSLPAGSEQAEEMAQIALAYERAARQDVALISLSKTIAAGGTVQRTLVWHKNTDSERRERFLLPRLAVCNADARFAYTLGVRNNGQVEFSPRAHPGDHASARIVVESGFGLAAGIRPAGRLSRWSSGAWSAMVPICPPEHRPARATTLASFFVLWEALWEWTVVPPPPGDPALLKHVGGDLYAVLAVWDLTELEQLVLAGRSM